MTTRVDTPHWSGRGAVQYRDRMVDGQPIQPARGRARTHAAEVIDGIFARQMSSPESRDSLPAKIARELAQEIIEGRVPPGGELPALDLSRRFGTSRTPVREALMMLRGEGLVDIPPRRRPRVTVLSVRVVREIYLLRAELQAVIARRVAEGGADLAPLEQSAAEMREAAQVGELDTFFWANVDFHNQLTLAAGDSTLKRTVDGLGLRVLQLRHRTLSHAGRVQRSLSDHERLLLALREGDGDLASALGRSIVMTALWLLLEDKELYADDAAD